jgi:hypothetical protein
MKTVDKKQELAILLPALIVNNLLETGKPPDIVKVRTVSPEIADEMEELGYSELSADLFHAFVRTGSVEKLDPEQLVDLRGPAVSAFIGA